MKFKFYFITLILIFVGCNHDSLYNMTGINRNIGSTGIRSSTVLNDRENFTETVLGDIINNPFEVNNLERALDSICIDTNFVIQATHHLLKFTNLSDSLLKLLGSDTSLILFDFPLNYKVETMGDFYQDPRFDTDEIPYFYSIVEVDKEFEAGINYDVEEEYAYDYSNPVLLAESFRITNNFEYVNDYLTYDDFVNNGSTFCSRRVLPPLIDCPPECNRILVVDDIYPLTYSWFCDCPDSNGSGNHTSACGCSIPSNPKTPAGCIRVETDNNGTEGVSIIQVLVADNLAQFLSPKMTYTNTNGCWVINERMPNNVWVWSKFLNQFSYERSVWSEHVIWGFLLPLKDYIGKFGEPHNNIFTLYSMPTTNGLKAAIYWAAATANNQVQIFNGMATSFGINTLPTVLDIFITHLTQRGAALMANQAVNMGGIIGGPNPSVLPDISLGIRNTRDEQNMLAFHEFAHASHFSLVGSTWWGLLFEAEFVNATEFTIDFIFETIQFELDPYGDGSNPLDGYIAIAESWAEHIGVKFSGENAEDLLINSGYIPEGLHEDLIDINTTGFDSGNGITDLISGYSEATIFPNLTSANIPQLRTRLLSILPAGNTTTSYTALFNSYGY